MKQELDIVQEPEQAQMGLGQLAAVAIILVVVGIIVAFGLQVQGDVKNDFTVNSLEYNATVKAQEGVSNLSDKLPTIGLIAAIVVVIGMLVGGLYVLANRM